MKEDNRDIMELDAMDEIFHVTQSEGTGYFNDIHSSAYQPEITISNTVVTLFNPETGHAHQNSKKLCIDLALHYYHFPYIVEVFQEGEIRISNLVLNVSKIIQKYRGYKFTKIHIALRKGVPLLFMATSDCKVCVISMNTGDLIGSIFIGYKILNMVLNPETNLLICMGNLKNQIVEVDISSESRNKLECEVNSPSAMDVNNTGKYLAIGTKKEGVYLFDSRMISEGKSITHFKSYQQGISENIKFSKTGNMDLLCFTESHKLFQLADMRDLTPYAVYGIDGQDGNIKGLCFSGNTDSIIVATDTSVFQFRLNTKIRQESKGAIRYE